MEIIPIRALIRCLVYKLVLIFSLNIKIKGIKIKVAVRDLKKIISINPRFDEVNFTKADIRVKKKEAKQI